MRHIAKGQEPQELSIWKRKNSDKTYKDLEDNAKSATKRALMKEQGFICCYCERELRENDSHIEHIEPQKLAPQKDLDFDNMLCSCQAEGEPLHCGHAKGNWFDKNMFISPLADDCGECFAFDHSGAINPKSETDTAAHKTIEILKLNIAKLKNMRKNAIVPFLCSSISGEDFKKFVDGYLLPSSDGTLNPFWSAVKSIFQE